MWIVCKAGFFNVVCSDNDEEKGLLTVKARDRNDLIKLEDFIPFQTDIEESNTADYRFRRKAPRKDVIGGFQTMLHEIDYSKTKPAIAKMYPERTWIYLNVWDELSKIQDP